MSQLSRRLLLGLGGTFCFGTLATGLTLAVKYKPYGVPDSRRQEYEQKLAELEQREQLLQQLDRVATPRAVAPETSHDFGLIDPQSTSTHAFVIRNEGDDPLALKVAETTCKCTVGALADTLLDPGESTEVTMTWNSGQTADQYEQSAAVVTNDPRRERITFTVQGTVRAEFVAPERVPFGVSDLDDPAETEFLVFSQHWHDFSVVDVEGDLDGLEWYAEPVENDIPQLRDREARSAWQIRLLGLPNRYGDYEGRLSLTVKPGNGGDEIVRTLEYGGKVRAPIGFYGPAIHKNDGLDIGTVVAGKEHQFHLLVRARGAESRKIEVLDVKPSELTATLAPLQAPGAYRLTVSVAADCPLVVFNAHEQHGYVQVGDPQDKGFSNWFPLYGAVVDLQN